MFPQWNTVLHRVSLWNGTRHADNQTPSCCQTDGPIKHDVSLAWLGRQAVLDSLTATRNEQLQLPLRREARPPYHPRPSDYAP